MGVVELGRPGRAAWFFRTSRRTAIDQPGACSESWGGALSTPVPNAGVAVEVAYEDPHYLVLNKAGGRVVQPGRGHQDDALLNGLLASRFGPELRKLGARRDFGVIHRLDRDTSGALLVARTVPGYDGLRSAFTERRVEKDYLVLVHPDPSSPSGRVDLPLREVERAGVRLAVPDPAGQPAHTAWRKVAAGPKHAMLACRISTGRLHQIRVHLTEGVGVQIMGDRIYRVDAPPDTSSKAMRLAGPMHLHAWRLGFPHPVTDRPEQHRIEPPPSFVSAMAECGLQPVGAQ